MDRQTFLARLLLGAAAASVTVAVAKDAETSKPAPKRATQPWIKLDNSGMKRPSAEFNDALRATLLAPPRKPAPGHVGIAMWMRPGNRSDDELACAIIDRVRRYPKFDLQNFLILDTSVAIVDNHQAKCVEMVATRPDFRGRLNKQFAGGQMPAALTLLGNKQSLLKLEAVPAWMDEVVRLNKWAPVNVKAPAPR